MIEKVTLERNDNRCSRAEISALVMNGGISSRKGERPKYSHQEDAHSYERN
jgi:hypothetical protein